MIVLANDKTFKEYLDFVYTISLDKKTSCYPSYSDGIKTKEDFIQSSLIDFKNHQIYLYYYLETCYGWIDYFVIEEDKYIQATCFSIKEHYNEALEEFINLITHQYKGYEFYFGCSKENIGIPYLLNHGFRKIEESFSYRLPVEKKEEKNVNLNKVRRLSLKDA
ncbi:MAG: hypothetical protein K2I42_01065, partial [Anaeroplasmataceae bacterium]|nr:hypothetical protein [Anaeroplasmataceae bacterium]